jgi:Uncharacterized protein conserved in bacteria
MSDMTALPVHMVQPLPGIGAHTDFLLAAVEGTDALYTLRATTSADTPSADGLRLFLLDPRAFFPDYTPRIPDSVTEELGGDSPVVLVVLHPGSAADGHTANLLAPIVIDAQTHRGRQVLLEGSDWPLRAPLASS